MSHPVARSNAVCRPTRGLGFAIACTTLAAAPAPAAAQWRSTLGISSAVYTDALGQRGLPMLAAAQFGYESALMTLDARGTWAGGGTGRARAAETAGGARAHLFSPTVRGWGLLAVPSGEATRLTNFQESGRLSLLGGVRWQRGAFEVRALGGRSALILGAVPERTVDFAFELRRQLGRGRVMLSSRGSQWYEAHTTEVDTVYYVAGFPFTGRTTRALNRSRGYVDTEASADWQLGFLQVEGRAGFRGFGEATSAARWAGVRLVAPLADRLAIVAEARRDPGSPEQGLPARRVASFGLHVATASLRRTRDDRVVRSVEPMATAEVAVSAESNGARTLVIRGLPGRRVEITGDLTNWTSVALEPQGPQAWATTLRIDPGVHHLLVRVDEGEWRAPPTLPTARHEFGSVGVLFVKP